MANECFKLNLAMHTRGNLLPILAEAGSHSKVTGVMANERIKLDPAIDSPDKAFLHLLVVCVQCMDAIANEPS